MCFHFCFCFFCWCFIRITSYAVGLKIYVITVGIKKYMSISKEKKNKHQKIVLSAKSKLDSIEVLIYKILINLIIIHDKFVLINNILKEFYGMKKKIKISNNKNLNYI